MPNPKNFTKFGVCPRCSFTGLDEDGNKLTGYELKKYKGEDMCTLCIIEVTDIEHDTQANERYIVEERFRGAIGMRNTVQ